MPRKKKKPKPRPSYLAAMALSVGLCSCGTGSQFEKVDIDITDAQRVAAAVERVLSQGDLDGNGRIQGQMESWALINAVMFEVMRLAGAPVVEGEPGQ